MNNAAKITVMLMAGLFAMALAGPASNLAFGDDHGPPDHHEVRGRQDHREQGRHEDRRDFREHGPQERREFDRRFDNRHFDDHHFDERRFDRDHYFPQRGVVVRVLPGGYHPYYYGGRRFFFAGGAWYAPGPDGFIVTAPPRGLRVSILPPFYTTVSFGGVPYYYADDVYYRWQPGLNAYEVVAPPPGADQAGAPPAEAPPPPAPPQQLYIYPKNGQSEAQQAQDRYECHTWAKGQTGFDPTQPDGGVSFDENGPKRSQYHRAMVACLSARGYSVR